MILAHDRVDVTELNRLARNVMDQAGLLGPERVTADGREWDVGDLLVCRRNDYRPDLDVRNGTRATVTDIDLDAGELTIRTDEGRPGGEPIKVISTHDFPSQATGKAIPYGGYDIAANEGFVNVAITSETAQLAAASIKAWWEDLGRDRYPDATALQITADCGGGNGNRIRLWKNELQRLADETGLRISVCHFPPGTSKWNKIEHRLFCHISQSWRGRPLISYEIVINSIAATTTSTGLKVYARLDKRDYPKNVQVTDDQLAAVNLTPDPFHPEWNYSISPQPATDHAD